MAERSGCLLPVEILPKGRGMRDADNFKQIGATNAEGPLFIQLYCNSGTPSFAVVEWYMRALYFTLLSRENVFVVPPLIDDAKQWLSSRWKREIKVVMCTSTQAESAFLFDETEIQCRIVSEPPSLKEWDEAPSLCIGQQSYDYAAVGGTFDHIHIGHRILLGMCAYVTRVELTVGVSGDPLLKNKKYAEALWPLEKRIEAVRSFLSAVNPRLQQNLFALEDPFGPTITDGRLSVIIVSAETESGAKAINIHRIERGMDEMDVLVVGLAAHGAVSADGLFQGMHPPFADARLFRVEGKISSTALRKRELEEGQQSEDKC